jgi:manganese/zinc/iron transport system permease protein
MSDQLWILCTGMLVAIVCALPGSLLMLRRQALMGDAIAHAVLPGIFLAYWVSGGADSLIFLPGAAISGWVAAQAIAWLSKDNRLSSDASTGLVFTFLFAVGVILISAFSRQTDLDQECVLFGDIIWVPLEVFRTEQGLSLGPQAVWILSITLVLFLAVIFIGFKGWMLTSFDPVFAQVAGYRVWLWSAVLMAMTSLSSVAAFRSVGAVLVIAFLAVPPAIAALYTKSLRRQLWDSCFWGSISTVSGWGLALYWDVSISGMMAVMTGVWFLIVWSFLRIRRFYKNSSYATSHSATSTS